MNYIWEEVKNKCQREAPSLLQGNKGPIGDWEFCEKTRFHYGGVERVYEFVAKCQDVGIMAPIALKWIH